MSARRLPLKRAPDERALSFFDGTQQRLDQDPPPAPRAAEEETEP